MLERKVSDMPVKSFLLFAIVIFAICISVSYALVVQELNRLWMVKIHSDPSMPELFWAVTNLGGDAFVVLLVLLMAERRSGNVTSWIFKTWLTGALVAQVIKNLFPTPRPGFVLAIDQLNLIDNPPVLSGSMPSGHALAAISCGLILCTMLVMNSKRLVWTLPVMLLSLVVAWSRVAVGAHWPADVFAGAGLAFLIVPATWIWEQQHSWNKWFQQRAGIGFLILIHFMIVVHLTFLPTEFLSVQLVQFSLCALAGAKIFLLFRKYFFDSFNRLEISQ